MGCFPDVTLMLYEHGCYQYRIRPCRRHLQTFSGHREFCRLVPGQRPSHHQHLRHRYYIHSVPKTGDHNPYCVIKFKISELN